ncbi:hypothetical protein YC2023_081440 [Brassica napus]
MDLLAGSTVMLPTVLCETCTVVGKCDICDTMASVTFVILLMRSCRVLRRRWNFHVDPEVYSDPRKFEPSGWNLVLSFLLVQGYDLPKLNIVISHH